MDNYKEFRDARSAVDEAVKIYDESRDAVLRDFGRFFYHIKREDRASAKFQREEFGYYPYIKIDVEHDKFSRSKVQESYGILLQPGCYGTSITNPRLFYDYYLEQFETILKNHDVSIAVGRFSDFFDGVQREIPITFIDEALISELSADEFHHLQEFFSLPDLSIIDDSIVNGIDIHNRKIRPLSFFTAERVDYSLQRLHHYTNTFPEHFQSFILMTNYQRYIDQFKAFAINSLSQQNKSHCGNDVYQEFVCGDDVIVMSDVNTEEKASNMLDYLVKKHNRCQMPACHLKRADGNGITFINIGVGPTNAKTITDHLAVLRPHCWIMLGHCGGLRISQKIGDYVLAHGYVRNDHVLDDDLPQWIPIPPITEVQMALERGIKDIYCDSYSKERVRTGTVFTTDNRNWEIRFHEIFTLLSQSRAIAIDLESATIAGNGFRFRIPYGAFLCVSDKPLHKEPKSKAKSDSFYKNSISQHLMSGIRAIEIMRADISCLHSRKLRGFDEPAFR